MKNFYIKHKKIINEIIRFCIVGGIATVVDYGLFMLFSEVVFPNDWGLNIALSTTVGFIGGVIVNYILSLVFVFKDVSDEKAVRSKKNMILFVFLGVIGLFLGIGIMELGKIVGNMNNFLYKTIIFVIKTLIVLVYNYITRKIFIFK